MSLSSSRLASALTPDIKAAFLLAGAANIPQTDTFCESLANAIASKVIAEITANAIVLPTLLVAPTGGGPVTGTGEIL